MHKKLPPNLIATATGILMLAAAFLPVAYRPAVAQQPGCQDFQETGRNACGKFLQYWQEHGSLAQQGYPISNEMQEKSDTDGKTYTVQYFERAVFELHPENQPPYDVLLSLLGNFLYKQKYPTGAPGQTPSSGAGSQLFEQTGHHVGGKFLNYWTDHGGLAQQGYPISDEFQEKSDLNGKTYTVQYFERAVFELHPENQPPYDVLLSQLGTFQYQRKHAAAQATPSAAQQTGGVQTVFVIVMENHNWADIKGSASAPYISNTLLPMGAHAEQYYNPPGIHPSEPNYIWMEAGSKLGITNDNEPSANHQSTTNHLVTLLNNKGISWKAYQEGISGKDCPLVSKGKYVPKHNPMVYFDDVTDTNNPNSPYCIAHERPYSELSADLQNNKVARYNFISPDLCHDMHNSSGCETSDSMKNGDNWLAEQVPAILASNAYKNGGALFITWDEGEKKSDGPIGMILLSPLAKAGGYSNTIHYTHSSFLRTLQEIFGVTPLLKDAANADNLGDLFRSFP
ncbi:MAG: alkaline phosphatase family protein [Chloroflexota bacterium]